MSSQIQIERPCVADDQIPVARMDQDIVHRARSACLS